MLPGANIMRNILNRSMKRIMSVMLGTRNSEMRILDDGILPTRIITRSMSKHTKLCGQSRSVNGEKL